MSALLSDSDIFGAGPGKPALLSDDDLFGPEDKSVPFGSVARGWNRLQQSGTVLLREAGVISDESAAAAIARDEADIAKYPPSPAVTEGLKEISEADGWGNTALAILTNPQAIISVIGESLPASMAQQTVGSAGFLATRGPTGLVGGTGLASLATEYSSTILDTMRDEGIDINDAEAVDKAFKDEALMAKARERGVKRGIPIATFDAVSFGLAGKFSKAIEGGAEAVSATRRGFGLATETAAQGATGAAGEATAQIADEGKISRPGDVLLEGAAEVVTGAPEVGIGIARRRPGAVPVDQATDIPQGAAPADTLYGSPDLTPAGDDIDVTMDAAAQADLSAPDLTPSTPAPAPSRPVSQPTEPFTGPEAPKISLPDAPATDPAVERPASPRLTAEDRASPIPNDLIDDGKAMIEAATAPRPSVAAAPPLPEGVYVTDDGRLRIRLPGWRARRQEQTDGLIGDPEGDILVEGAELAFAKTINGKNVSTLEQWNEAHGASPSSSRDIAPASVLSDADLFGAAPSRPAIQRRDIAPDTAVTAAGREVPVTYAVVEASSLVPSQRDEGGANPAYPSELQPRDRERAVSAKQVNDIAQKLNPRLIDKSPRASDGAPIVAEDGVVESGNGRVLAIRRAYAQSLPTAAAYRAHLAAQGYPVDGMSQPVLVRVRSGQMTPQDRQAFTREANERDTLGMSATERAMADAAAMTPNVLSLYRGGDLDQAGNRDFVRAFMQSVVGANEQAAMVDANGAISQDAIRRVRASLLAKAYGDADLVGALEESADTNIKAIGGALTDVAAEWAQMRAEAQAGQISPDVDQTERLLEAVRLVERARKEGQKIGMLVDQTDMLTGRAMHPFAEKFLRLMFRNDRSWTQPAGRDNLASALRFYVTEARKTSAGTDLLGEVSPGPDRILDLAKDKNREPDQAAQPTLGFGSAPAAPAGKDAGLPGKSGTIETAGGRQATVGEGNARTGDQPAGKGEVRATAEDAAYAVKSLKASRVSVFEHRRHIYYSPLRPIGFGFPIKGEPIDPKYLSKQADADRVLATADAIPIAQLARLELAPITATARLDALKEAIAAWPGSRPNRYEFVTTDKARRANDGSGATITRSAKGDGWQLTTFDSRGFSGDMQFKTLDEALSNAITLGTYEPAPGHLKDMMALETFVDAAAVKPKETGASEASWLKSLVGEEREAVLAAMRDISAKVQRIYDDPNNRTPYGQRAAGSEGSRQTIKAGAMDAVRRAVGQGKTPDQAAAIAKAETRELIKTHNRRMPGEQAIAQHWGIDDGAYDREIDHTAALLRDALMIQNRAKAAVNARPEPAPQAALKAKMSAKRQETVPKAKIADFGEKIEGARKDQVRDLADSLTADVDILTEPLSKIFPQPDYVKLAEAGVDRRALALIAVSREQIPAKPRKGYKVKSWAEQVRALRGFANSLLSGEYDAEAIRAMMLRSSVLSGLADTATVISGLDPAMLPGAAKWRVTASSYTMLRGERFDKPKRIYALVNDKGRLVPEIAGETLESITEPARAAIRAALGKDAGTDAPRRTPLSLYTDRLNKTYFIGFKGQSGVIRLKTGFASIKDARSYREEHADELQAAIDAMRAGPQMRRPENRPREGVARREGDVSPEQFQEAFGFRGVQFGNYVEEGRRQFELNEAFDGLMDLATVLGIPPQALSLNGTLGLAFGARGHGSAKAHYEPTHVVINLTKTKGAGSLAHEWFHGVDHYFSNQDAGKKTSGFMSERRRNEGLVRQEVFDAFKEVEKSLTGGAYSARLQKFDDARAKPYWNTMVEKAARGFEKYVVDRLALEGATNDYLANIDENAGAYPTNDEMRNQGISEAFDGLFGAIDTRETEQGVEMFSLAPPRGSDAFKRWFGDSKVVDEAGKPLVVYRGQSTVDWDTGEPLETLKRGSEFPSFQIGEPGVGIAAFFTDDVSVAEKFRDLYDGDNRAIYSVYISMQKPFVIDADGKAAGAVQFGKEGQPFRDAIRSGEYDGVIIRNTRDEGTLYVPLKPTQIKSVNNRGTFDPADPRILYSKRGEAFRVREKSANVETELVLTDAFVEKADALTASLRAALDQMGLNDVAVRVSESIRAIIGGQSFAADGRYFKGLIDVALDAEDPASTLNHEAIHAMRRMGLFTDTEWAILSRKSKKEWIDRYSIAEGYSGFPEWAQVEEGIAHAYADWTRGARMDGLIARSFKRIKAMLKALAKALSGLDFRTAAEIFEGIASGEAGTRPRTGRQPKSAAFQRMFPAETVDTLDGPREQLVIPGAEKISDKSLAERRMAGPMKPSKAQKDASGLPLFGDDKDQLSLFQSAWHGTPHRFDKFKLNEDTIGTGEGAQAFGWGLYFAGKRSVGEYYRNKLAAPTDPDDVAPDAEATAKFQAEWDRVTALMRPLTEKMADPSNWRMRDDLMERMSPLQQELDDIHADMVQDTINRATKPGALYEVDVPEDGELLNWDRPIADQPDTILEKLKAAFGKVDERMTGKEFYDDLSARLGRDAKGDADRYMVAVGTKRVPNDQAASIALRDAGIPGHRFLDQGSRAFGWRIISAADSTSGKWVVGQAPNGPNQYFDNEVDARAAYEKRFRDGSYNYVIYDDSRIKIEQMFKLRRAPQTTQEAQSVMQGFITRGQPIDRAIRVPFDLLGGLDRNGIWTPGKRVIDKIGPAGLQGAGIGGVIGAGIGTFVGGPVGTVAGAVAGGTVGGYLLGGKIAPTGRFGWLHGVAENARRGLVDRYGLDPDYIKADATRATDQRGILQQAEGILKVLSNASVGKPEAKALQAILTGENVTETDMTALAVPIRQAIDDLGAEAVSLGLISAESFERNRGAYLHRVYLKNEIDQDTLGGWVAKKMAASRKRIIGDEMKGRGLFWDVPVDRLMQDVPDWKEGAAGTPNNGDKFRVLDEVHETGDMLDGESRTKPTRRVYWPAGKAVPERYQGAAWQDRGTWEVRKTGKTVTLWRDYTKAEREKMGEIVDARYTIAKTFMLMANDLSTGRFFKQVSENENWTQSEPPATQWREAADYNRFWNDPEIAWVKVPDTTIADTGGKKRWGALSGKFVRAEIWRDLNELQATNTPGTWRKLLTQWKLNKTARSPVVHMNNIMSNMMFMDMADVRMQDLAAGVRAYYEKNADYIEARDNGAFGQDMMSQEIRENVLKPILEEIARDEQGGAANSFLARAGKMGKFADILWTWAKAADRKMLDAYQVEDELFRMATFIRRRRQGDSPEAAAQNARDQFLNYDIRAPWINAARNTVFPFISYTYRAVPKLAENIAHRPWKVAKYFAIAYAVNALAYMGDDGDDGEERERASLRDEEQGYTWLGVPRMLRMPYRDQNGLPVFLDVRRWIPAGDIFDVQQGQAAIPVPAPLQFGGPLMLAFEFLLNRQAFTGQDITNELTDDNSDRAEKVGDWLWKSWMPSAVWVPNSWYWTKVGNALRGAEDAAGRPYSTPEALASSVGIKLKPQDVESGLYWHNNDLKKVQLALRSQMRQLGRQRERNLISQAEYDKQAARITEKFARLGEAAEDLDRRSQPKKAE